MKPRTSKKKTRYFGSHGASLTGQLKLLHINRGGAQVMFGNDPPRQSTSDNVGPANWVVHTATIDTVNLLTINQSPGQNIAWTCRLLADI